MVTYHTQVGRHQYEPIFACRALAAAEDEGRARTGHLKRYLQERGDITRVGAWRAATSKENVQLLLLGGASGGCTAAGAAAAGCGASRLERGEVAARKKKKRRGSSISASAEFTSVVNGSNCGGTQK